MNDFDEFNEFERLLDDGCPHDGTIPCPACAGSGTRTQVYNRSWGKVGEIVRCDGCGGDGRVSRAGTLQSGVAL